MYPGNFLPPQLMAEVRRCLPVRVSHLILSYLDGNVYSQLGHHPCLKNFDP
jgi:hypothetical protein